MLFCLRKFKDLCEIVDTDDGIIEKVTTGELERSLVTVENLEDSKVGEKWGYAGFIGSRYFCLYKFVEKTTSLYAVVLNIYEKGKDKVIYTDIIETVPQIPSIVMNKDDIIVSYFARNYNGEGRGKSLQAVYKNDNGSITKECSEDFQYGFRVGGVE